MSKVEMAALDALPSVVRRMWPKVDPMAETVAEAAISGSSPTETSLRSLPSKTILTVVPKAACMVKERKCTGPVPTI